MGKCMMCKGAYIHTFTNNYIVKCLIIIDVHLIFVTVLQLRFSQCWVRTWCVALFSHTCSYRHRHIYIYMHSDFGDFNAGD